MSERILVVYDVDGWAYHHSAVALQRHAPPDLVIDIATRDRVDWGQKYSLVFGLCYRGLPELRDELARRGVGAPLIGSFNTGARGTEEVWRETLWWPDFLVVNNVHRWRASGVAPRTCCISNGVESVTFKVKTPIGDRPHRCLWSGSERQSELKGYQAVIEPLRDELPARGFECSFHLVDSMAAPLSATAMANWYDSGSYILCASDREGTPNPIIEGMSCGCVAVSTPVGNVPEFGLDGENCVLAERSVESFVEKLEYAREHRERISAAGVQTMRSWRYGPDGRAQYFYQLWRRIIRDGADSVTPFSYHETDWRDI